MAKQHRGALTRRQIGYQHPEFTGRSWHIVNAHPTQSASLKRAAPGPASDDVERHPIRPARRRVHVRNPRPALERTRQRLVRCLAREYGIARRSRKQRHQPRVFAPIPGFEVTVFVDAHQPYKSCRNQNAELNRPGFCGGSFYWVTGSRAGVL